MTRALARRPWGHVDWILGGFPAEHWSVIACVATEDRWPAALACVADAGCLSDVTLFQVAPTAAGPAQHTAQARLDAEAALAERRFGAVSEAHHLFERLEVLVRSVRRFLSTAQSNIIIDISCFPKRFFFPIVKLLSEAPNVVNLVVTYTHAEGYADGRLAEDPEPSRPLPMFTGALEQHGPQKLVVSTGVEPLGLPQIVEGEGGFPSVSVLVPFPAPPPLGKRNWEVLRLIDKSQGLRHGDLVGIDVNDVPRTFAHLDRVANSHPERLSFAPFGAKPVSLAMCLYALSVEPERRPAVLYTQPRRYAAEYSHGIRQTDGRPHVSGYIVRHEGRSLYA